MTEASDEKKMEGVKLVLLDIGTECDARLQGKSSHS